MDKGIVINATLDKREFMTNSRDVARAISSLKGTVAQTGRSISSSASSYGTAFRQTSQAVREYNQRLKEIGASIDALRSKNATVEQAAKSFKDLSKEIKDGESSLGRMSQKVAWLKTKNDKAMAAWNANEKALTSSNTLSLRYREQYNRAMERGREIIARIKSGKDESGNSLTSAQMAADATALKEYTEKARGYWDKFLEYKKQYQEATAKRDEMIANGENKPMQEYLDAQAKLNQMEQEQAERTSRLTEMRKNGYENADQTQEYKDRINMLNELEQAAQNAQNTISNIKPPYLQSWENMSRLSGLISEGFGRIENAASGALYAITHPVQAIDRALGTVIVKVSQAVASFARMAGSSAISFLKKLASAAGNAAIQLAKLATNAVTSGFKKIASGAAAATKGILSFTRSHKSSHNGLKTGLKTVLKYAFGVRSMYFLFRRLRTAVTQAFTEMAKSSPEVKTAINGLQTALNGLKGSLASAFAPIFTAIAPALTYLINMLTAAMNTIGAFFAALTGKGAFKKAVGGMKSTGGSAGKASKKVKELKRELAGFDELTILNADKDSGSGGGGGGGSGSGITYKTEQISSGIKDFVKEIKTLWDSGEYEKLGRLLGKHINKGLAKAYAAVKWDNVKKKWTKAIDAFTGIFNGLVRSIDWNLIGKTIMEGVNTLINAADYLVSHIDFASAGAALADGFNGLFSNPNLFSNAWEVFKKTVKGVLKFADVFLEKFNEAQLAEDIRKVFEDGPNGGWESIAKSAWEVIKKAFNKTGNFLNVLLGGENKSNNEKPEESLKPFARKRPENIKPNYTVDDSVWDDLATTLAEGFNKAVDGFADFIENLPVTQVVGALAGWLQKFRTGINWEGVGRLFGASFRLLFNFFGSVISDFKDNASDYGADIADALNAAIDAAFPEGEGGPGQIFSDAVKGAFDFVTAFVAKLKEDQVAEKLKKEIKKIDWKGIAEAAWTAFKTAISKLGNFLTVLFDGEVDVKPDVVKPSQKPGKGRRSNESVEVADTGTGKKSNTNDLSVDGLAKTISNAVVSVLDSITKAIESVDWTALGKTVAEFIFSLDWPAIGTAIFSAFKAAIEGIWGVVSGMDDVISEKLLGEDYQENIIWKATHPFKNVEYQQQKRAQWREDNPVEAAVNDAAVRQGLDALGNYLNTIFNNPEEYTGSGDLLTDLADYLGNTNEAQEQATNLVKAANLIMEQDGTAAEEIVQGFIDNGIPDDVIRLVADALGVNTEALTFSADATQAGAEATVDNTTAIENNPPATVEDNSLAESTAQELFDKAIELLKGGSSKEEAVSDLASHGASPEKVSAVDEALDHVHKTFIGWIEDGSVKEILEAAEKAGEALQTYEGTTPEGEDSAFDGLKESIDANTAALDEFDWSEWEALWDNPSGEGGKDVSGTVDIEVNNPDGSTTTVESGENLVDDVITGVENKQGELDQTMVDTAQGGIETFAEENGISSPSTVFQEFGEFIVDGLILGLQTLPQALQGVWQGLPQWAQALLGNAAGEFKLAISGGVGGNGGGGNVAPTEDNASSTKATKRQTKETKKLTKETRKNTKKRAEVDVNYEGAGFDTSSGKPVLNVGVNFAPNGEDPSEENSNKGLMGWLQELFDADTIEAKVALIRKGWENFKGWLAENGLNENSPIGQLIDLIRNNFDTVAGFLGIDPKSPIGTFLKLLLDNADNLLAFLGIDKNTPISTVLKLFLDNAKNLLDFLGIPEDSPIRTFIDLLMGDTDPEIDKVLGKDGEQITIWALLKKALESKTPAELWANIVEILAKLTGTDPDSFTIDGLFGTLLNVLATLGKKNPNDSSGGLFGTLISVLATLSKKDANQTPAKVIGTALGVLYTLGKKDDDQTLAKKIGTALSVLYTLGKKDDDQTLAKKIGTALGVAYSLSKKDDNQTLAKKIGTALSVAYSLKKKDKNQTLAKKIGTSLSIGLSLSSKSAAALKSAATKALKGIKVSVSAEASGSKGTIKAEPVAGGGTITRGGKRIAFASGGVISGGMARYLSSVPHYAGGTTRAHGTVFVAGEAGPEIMGHINGRTEILNKSQIAEAIYSAVVSGMGAAVNALGKYIANHMTNCTNAIVQTIGANAGIASVSGMNYYPPAMVTSGIMPYDVSMQIARSTAEIQNTLNSNNEELIQAMVSAMGNAANSIVQVLQRQMMQAQANGRGYTTRQAVDDINRSTLMFGASPLKGV